MALAAGMHVEAARFFHAARDTLAAAGDSGMRQVGEVGEGGLYGAVGGLRVAGVTGTVTPHLGWPAFYLRYLGWKYWITGMCNIGSNVFSIDYVFCVDSLC